VTDPDEAVVESYEYGPYGETEIFDASSSSVSTSQIGNPFMYTGRRLDEESGLYYYRARHYSPELKRFIQRDPIGYADGPSAFAYVNSAPTRSIDPQGLAETGAHGDSMGAAVAEAGGSEDASAAAVAGNEGEDHGERADDASRHSQTEPGQSEDEAREERDEENDDLYDEAVDAAKGGDYGAAWYKIGQITHSLQDELFHNWCCIDEHTAFPDLLWSIVKKPWTIFSQIYYGVKDLLACCCYKRDEMVATGLLVIRVFEVKLDDPDVMAAMLGYKK